MATTFEQISKKKKRKYNWYSEIRSKTVPKFGQPNNLCTKKKVYKTNMEYN